MADKGFMSIIYKELLQTTPKWAKNINRLFTKSRSSVNTHMKRCSTSLQVRKMEIRVTLKHHCSSTKLENMKKGGNP